MFCIPRHWELKISHLLHPYSSVWLVREEGCYYCNKKRKVYLSRSCYHGLYLNNRPGLRAIYQTLGFGTILGTNLESWHDKHQRNVQRTQMFFGLGNLFSLFTMFWVGWRVSESVTWSPLLPNSSLLLIYSVDNYQTKDWYWEAKLADTIWVRHS